MLFSKSIFKIENQECYFKYQMNGFDDPDLKTFQFLSYSPMLKQKFVRDTAEKEYINSYIVAAKIIAENSKLENPAIKFVIKDYSLALPCIFLCRQAIELSIKRSLTKRKHPYEYIHTLKDLWAEFEESVENESKTDDDIRLLNAMRLFVSLISEFDNKNGTRLRYSEDKGGKMSQEKLIFVDLQQITMTTELFVKQLKL